MIVRYCRLGEFPPPFAYFYWKIRKATKIYRGVFFVVVLFEFEISMSEWGKTFVGGLW